MQLQCFTREGAKYHSARWTSGWFGSAETLGSGWTRNMPLSWNSFSSSLAAPHPPSPVILFTSHLFRHLLLILPPLLLYHSLSVFAALNVSPTLSRERTLTHTRTPITLSHSHTHTLSHAHTSCEWAPLLKPVKCHGSLINLDISAWRQAARRCPLPSLLLLLLSLSFSVVVVLFPASSCHQHAAAPPWRFVWWHDAPLSRGERGWYINTIDFFFFCCCVASHISVCVFLKVYATV